MDSLTLGIRGVTNLSPGIAPPFRNQSRYKFGSQDVDQDAIPSLTDMPLPHLRLGIILTRQVHNTRRSFWQLGCISFDMRRNAARSTQEQPGVIRRCLARNGADGWWPVSPFLHGFEANTGDVHHLRSTERTGSPRSDHYGCLRFDRPFRAK